MDYTAIIVALISLFGMIWQSLHNSKTIKKNNATDKLNNITDAILYMLQDRLLFLCKAYIARGYIGTTEYKLLSNMYKAYHNIGGNDFISELYERCKVLPIKDVDEC